MSEPRSVLVLDDGTASLRELVSRLRHLGLETHRVKRPAQAQALLASEAGAVAVIFLTPDRLGSDLDALCTRAAPRDGSPGPGLVAVGPRPDDATCGQLREAGIQHALWEPYDDGTLRFVVNQHMGPVAKLDDRVELRVPTTLFARIEVGARRKEALIYNLSLSGVFLETPRPSMRGARMVVEIPLPDGALRAPAQVVYTNTPGSLFRASLPLGMAARFLEIQGNDRERLRRYIEERADRLRV